MTKQSAEYALQQAARNYVEARKEFAAGQEQLAKSAGIPLSGVTVNGMDKPGETGLTPASPANLEPVARYAGVEMSWLKQITLHRPGDIVALASLPGMCLWLGWWGLPAALLLGLAVNAQDDYRRKP